jgi:hypothetical protein
MNLKKNQLYVTYKKLTASVRTHREEMESEIKEWSSYS